MGNVHNQLEASQTQRLLQQANGADSTAAVQQLFELHRDRLRRMLAVHMDPRINARVDPSDIIQETLLQASRKLPEYLQQNPQPLPFYPWLRQIAWEQLMQLHRRHLRTHKRTAAREASPTPVTATPDHSIMSLAEQLSASITSPSERVIRDELHQRMRAALMRLPQIETDVLVLRYLEQLSIKEIAAVLGISEAAATKRHIRGLQHLREAMAGTSTVG